MDKLIVKFEGKEEPTVYNIVTFLKNKSKSKEVLFSNVQDLIRHPLTEWHEIVHAEVNRGDGDGESKPYESKYERENIALPKEMAKEIVEVATSLKGCTIDFVNRCNKVLNFDLHEKLNNKYGFTGAKRLYNIFKLN